MVREPADIQQILDVGLDIFAVVWLAPQPGVSAGDVGHEPAGMIEHPDSVHVDFSLDGKMTALAKSWAIPPPAIRFIAIQMVDG